MLTTLVLVGATLLYLTICQQNMIKVMQQNLYQSLLGQLDESAPQGEDSGVENKH